MMIFKTYKDSFTLDSEEKYVNKAVYYALYNLQINESKYNVEWK